MVGVREGGTGAEWRVRVEDLRCRASAARLARPLQPGLRRSLPADEGRPDEKRDEPADDEDAGVFRSATVVPRRWRTRATSGRSATPAAAITSAYDHDCSETAMAA